MATPRKSARMETRASTEVFLIGQPQFAIRGGQLPTLRQVMKLMAYVNKDKQSTISQRERETWVVNQVVHFWEMAGIPTKTPQNCITQLHQFWSEYVSLRKNKSHEGTEAAKRAAFNEQLNKLFDIAAPDAYEQIMKNRLLAAEKKQEDIDFLKDQRGERSGHMDGMDKVYGEQVRQRDERIQRQVQYSDTQKATDLKAKATTSHFQVGSSGFSSSEDSGPENADPDFTTPTQRKTPVKYITLQVPKNLLDSPEVCATMDRFSVTDNAATALLASFIKASGGKLVEGFVISRSTTRRHRMAMRQNIALDVLDQFRSNPPEFLALHWDGKWVRDRQGQGYDALAIILSGAPGYEEGKLVGVQKLAQGTGEAQANATMEMIELWGVEDRIVALVFDTTSSNTGWMSGAAIKIEEKLGRKLLYLACRHHVLEIVIGAVCQLILEPSTSPSIHLFQRFQNAWPEIDKTKERRQLPPLSQQSEWKLVTDSILSALTELDLRGDYRECANNALFLLRHPQAPDNAGFLKPGATSDSRWMNRLLYLQKIYIWAGQFPVEDLDKLERLNLFICTVYVSHWLNASRGADAPSNDLRLFHQLLSYPDQEIAMVAKEKLDNHKWYLTQEVVVFSLFSNVVPDTIKSTMARKLANMSPPESYRLGKPLISEVTVSSETMLPDLVGPDSHFLLSALGIVAPSFLTKRPRDWEEDEDYLKARAFVRTVKVVNDAAERGVQLNSKCARVITDDDVQRNFLMQVIEQNRKQYPDFSKKTLDQ